MSKKNFYSNRVANIRETLVHANLSFLQGLPEEKRRALLAKGIILYKKTDSLLFMDATPVKSIWIIVSGQVKLSVTDNDGNEQILGIFSDMEVIWESLFLPDSRYPYSGICLTPVTVCAIPVTDFRRILEDPDISFNIITLLSAKLRDANRRNTMLSSKSPESRLIRLLLYYGKRTENTLVQLKLNDIAASLSLRPETVSRKLHKLMEEGLIERAGRGKIRILNYDALQDKLEDEY